jgi:signal transduction histidine kinase
MMNWAPSQYSILIHPEDKELVMKQSRKKQAGDKDVLIRYHFRGLKKSNKPIFLEVFAKTISLNGKPAELVMLNDITVRKIADEAMEKLMEEINQQNQKLKELDNAKDEMLEIISHELRTPLTSILGFVELLSTNDSNLKEEQKDHMRILKRNTQRLNQLVETILNINKLELGKVLLDIKSFDFQQLINSVLEELYYRIKQKMHRICLDIPPNFKIRADEELIHQVISNLITNAIKYTPDRGTISIKGKKHGIKLLFSIKDTGIGMDREDLPKLFQKFERISYQEEKRLGDVKGIGLGLYLSKKIIELHGGKMWAESEGINQGSTFFFELPDQS